jgi:hypothetical protein
MAALLERSVGPWSVASLATRSVKTETEIEATTETQAGTEIETTTETTTETQAGTETETITKTETGTETEIEIEAGRSNMRETQKAHHGKNLVARAECCE